MALEKQLGIAVLLPALACCLMFHSLARAQQDYPNKPIRLTIPFPPGGASDILARTVADRLTESLRQRVVVDNRPGGGGLIAIETVSRTAPDGYSLLQIATSFVINPSLYKSLPYNAEKDFLPVSLLAIADNILVVHPSLPARTVREFIALGRSRPGQLNYAHSGFGTQAYLAAELFKQTTSINMVPVAYKGTPGSLIDVMSGQVHLMFAGAPPALPHIRSSKLRAVAVTGKERLPDLPAVPTVAETIPGFEAAVWYGLLAPAGTPREAIMKLHTDTNTILRNPGVRERLAGFGFQVLGSESPEQFAAFMRAEGAKWAKVIRDSGTKAEN